MKKLILSGLLLFAAVSGYSQGAQPTKHLFESFIQGWQPQPAGNADILGAQSVAVLLTTNNGTGLITQTSTNILIDVTGTGAGNTLTGFTNLYGQAGVSWFVQGQPYGVTYGTNAALVGYYGTNVANGPGAWITPYIGPGMWAANLSAGVAPTNQYGFNVFYQMLSAGVTNTLGNNTLPSSAFADCKNICDASGDYQPATISMSACTDKTTGTNVVIATFQKTYNGLAWDTNTITLQLYCNGTNETMNTTNLTTTQMVGVQKWRLLSVSCGTNNAADMVFLTSCGLSGYGPN